jgi:hypothetical protein
MKVLALLLALAAGARAQTTGPRDAPLGGRPAGLGHAYTALADDAYAPAWNPAGLGFSAVPQAALLHASAVGGSPTQQALLALPLGGGLGAGASLDFTRGGAAYGAALGKRVTEHASFGAAARYLEGPAEEGRPHGTAADLAALYRFDDRLSIGAAAANLGGRPQALRQDGDQAPQARMGAGYSPAAWLTWALEGVFLQHGDAGVRSGVELVAWRALAARVGIDSTVEGSPALGLTMGVGLSLAGQSLDFAYVPAGSRSWEQASLVVRFGRLPEKHYGGGFSALDRRSPAAASAEAEPVRTPARGSREQPRTFHFDAGSSTATLVTAPAAPPPAAPGVNGFVQPADNGAWGKPRQPEIPEKPDVQEPVQPGMIWLQ